MFTRIVAIIFVAIFGILVVGGSVIKPKPGIRFLEPILKCYGDGQNGNMGRPQSDDEIIKMVCQDMKVGTVVTTIYVGPQASVSKRGFVPNYWFENDFLFPFKLDSFSKEKFYTSQLALKSETDHKNRHNHSFQNMNYLT